MLFLIDSQEVSTMAVFNESAVGNLNIFENFEMIVDDGEHFEAWREGDRHKQTTGVLGRNQCTMATEIGSSEKGCEMSPFLS